MAETSNRPRNKQRKRRFYKRKAFWACLILFFVAAGIFAYVAAEAYTRPYRERAKTYDLEAINNVEIPSLILDRNDKEIGRIFLENRSVIPIDRISEKNIINALVAGEDSRFWTHDGVDYMGIIRAGWYNYKDKRQGASTITQQLARNAYDLKNEAVKRNESTIERKLVEAFLAQRIEKHYNKEQIIGFYLNRIYFGSGYYGIRSAALGYFGKEPQDLTVDEAASIVTLIKNPNGRTPLRYPTVNRDGRNYVLKRMHEEDMISKDEMERLQALPLNLNPQPLQRGTTHLYERVVEAVAKALGEDATAIGGFKIHTTILAEAQSAAEKALEDSLLKAEMNPGYKAQKHSDYKKPNTKPPEYVQGAVLMVDHETGEVLAHVGGRDYSQAPYDFIEYGKRPLGTAFFPFIYAMSLSAGQTPATILTDEEMDNRSLMVGGLEGIVAEWGAEVLKPPYMGNIPLPKAFEYSKIGATVQLGQKVGLQKIVDGGNAFGFSMKNAELLPRLCVGWEQASMKQVVRAMSTFAKDGHAGPSELVYVDRVEDSTGHTLYRRQRSAVATPQVIDEATAFQVHHMMADAFDHGPAAGIRKGLIQKPFNGAGKGGSTFDFSDTWFVGYNKRVTCGVWAGFLQGAGGPIYQGAFSRDIAMPVWQAAMNAATPSFGDGEITPPAKVVEVPICSVSGQRATQFCQQTEDDPATGMLRQVSTKTIEYFRKGTENLPFCSVHSGMSASGQLTGLGISTTLDVAPVRPQSPALLGDDPYHTESPSYAPVSSPGGFRKRSTNALDSFDIGDPSGSPNLKRPGRLNVEED